MGSSASKGGRAAGAATRRYPTRVTSTTPRSKPSTAAPSGRERPPDPVAPRRRTPNGDQDEAVNLDGADPHYAASLRKLGAVQASATFNATALDGTHSPDADPRANPAIQILTARERLEIEAEKEFAGVAKSEQTQRRFLDIGTLQQVLAMRDDGGASAAEIERKFGLQQGLVESLGTTGVVGAIRSS